MARNNTTQEVSCVVALPTTLYPALLHRKQMTSANVTATGSIGALGTEEVGGHPREVCAPGVVLEVRQLWQPATLDGYSATGTKGSMAVGVVAAVVPSQSSTELTGSAARSSSKSNDLYAFVRVKDADHRLSGWFPLHQVYVRVESAITAFGDSSAASTYNHVSALSSFDAMEDTSVPSAASRGLTDDWVSLSRVLHRPWLSGVYDEVTPGMARTQRARRQLDYMEERLLRDCRTPTTVRFFVYLNTYVFAPWYYAPFGLLNSEYDATLPCSENGVCADGTKGEMREPPPTMDATETLLPPPPQLQPHPYIRDAFLCPFSLRIFSTYAQLHYETRAYRAGRLRPPGEEIYRDDERGLSLFRINGSQHVTYCRHLFLIGKSFLENKLAGHDVHSYFFYVVCLHHRYFPNYVSDKSAMFFAGFFTWEKHVSEYNLACIATLPCFGRRAAATSRLFPSSSPSASLPLGKQQGGSALKDGASASASPPSPPQVLRNIGQFMIAVSYELAYRRKQIGTPEKPLSDLGASAYQRYWRRALVRWMKTTLNEMRRAATIDVDSSSNTAGASRLPAALEKQGDEKLSAEADSVSIVALMMTEKTGDERRGAKAARSGGGTAAGKRKRARTGAGAAVKDDGTNKFDRDVEGAHTDGGGDDEGVDAEDGGDGPDSNEKRRQPTNNTAATSSSSPPLLNTFTGRTTIKEIAAAVRLEEADVLRTLLGLGVLHRSSEDRSIQLLLPQRYVDWMYDGVLRWESSVSHAVFQPALLKGRGRAR